jgi:hypothetical protein
VPVRVRPALLVLALGLTVGVVASLVLGRPSAEVLSLPTARSTPVSRPAVEDRALAVLHAWDVRRSAAWASGDAAALAALYTAGSSAGAADVALLERYTARGLVVRDLRMQLLRARVLAARPRLVEVEVTDRLSNAVAVRLGDPVARHRLPADAATTRLLVLRRVGDRWVMARVSAVRGR